MATKCYWEIGWIVTRLLLESKVNIANNNALTVYMSNCFNQNTGYVFESRELHLLPFWVLISSLSYHNIMIADGIIIM